MNENIYGSLEFYSKETQSTPSDKRDLGVFGDVAPYALQKVLLLRLLRGKQ
ncbi:TPA: hypothetical protein RZK20_001632 [Campylobacter coli]|nr:hypothetical protein [Campylobacter jejuni]HEB7570644.1 hypothetical protein [Campylobacter coli]HEB9322427.1 hypothetical protein [Campylobacter coli]HEB9345081.1 hypothetical protein [Campylobacter coli]HEB9350793.1 hypothetical protein [Campylobacter coli]